MSSVLLLDNVVLSGFYQVGWFDALKFWRPEYELVVTDFIWEEEFDSYHEYGHPPEWLEIIEIVGEYEAEKPGALSFPDWSCVIAADRRSGILVTRDSRLKSAAESVGVSTMWSGRFLVDTYVGCGISEMEFEDGIDEYLAEAHLPDSTVDTILNAEKGV